MPFIEWINAVVEFLRKTPLVADFTFRDGTRAVAGWIEWPLDLLEGILISGFANGAVPSLPWTMIVGLAAVWGWYLRGWRLSLLAGGCVLYLALFGKWKLSMITLSAVLVAAPVAGAIGLGLGILAVKWRGFERILWPLLNVMQSLPHFSYLIPVAVFIGVSHKAGTIATILFAMPPMARLTILGLRGVSPEIVEAGLMAGCTRLQMLRKVEIPAARPTIMVGVNQVIARAGDRLSGFARVNSTPRPAHPLTGHTSGNSGPSRGSPSRSRRCASGNGGETSPPRSLKRISSPTHRWAKARRRADFETFPGAPCTVRKWKAMASPGAMSNEAISNSPRRASMSGIVSSASPSRS